MVLTGGTTNLPGIAELGLEVTHMPVRIGTPPQLYGVSDSLIDPAFSTAVGLLLWKQTHPDTPKAGETGSGRSFMSDLTGLFGRKQAS
jgi:cell division protein FtsA